MEKKTIAVSATFTAEPVEETLAFWLQELHLPFTIKFAPYNQVFHQVLDPGSLLSRNQSGVNVVLVRLEDLQEDDLCNKSAHCSSAISVEKIERSLRDLVLALKSVAERTAIPYLVGFCPPSDKVIAESSLASHFQRLEQAAALELGHTRGIYMIQIAEWDALSPLQTYYDAQADELAHVPFTPLAFVAIGTAISRKIYALSNVPHKVVVLDCDQTLWKGVVGEDGVQGIEIDPARRALQEFILAQQQSGMLVCLCSKNNEEDVTRVFRQRRDMPLTWNRIIAWRINWRAKSENLRSLAEELGLGLDSFIFIDDDPIECAEVQANCPEVLTVQLPRDEERIPTFLKNIWAFDSLGVTEEDYKRLKLYKEYGQRETLRIQSASFEDFLAGLSLEIIISKMSRRQLARVSQLTQRTNQFNLTTRRRSEIEILALCESGNLECMVLEASDRFGDYGLVGVIMFRVVADAIEVDTFLLSCRTLGRGVEHRMVAKLGQVGKERGCAWINIEYLPTKKNQPAFDFLESIGAEFKQQTESGYLYRLPADFAAMLTPGSSRHQTSKSEERTPEHALSGISDQRPAETVRAKTLVFQKICLELYEPEQVLKAIESKKHRSLPEEARDFVSPKSEEEIRLVKIWEELLAIEPIGINTNFFHLGGTSLITVRMFAEIERIFGKRFPLVALLEAPTIKQLARLITQNEKTSNWNSLVAIQPEGSKPPLFCVHAAGGSVLFYRDLARHMGPDQPLYAFQAQRIDQVQFRHKRVEDMAAHYINEMRAQQPEGPYYLAGACFGGLVAYEIAQQLQAQGQVVALLALFNTNGPGYPKTLPGGTVLRARLHSLARRVEHHWGSLMMLPHEKKMTYLMSKTNKAARIVLRHLHLQRKALLRGLYRQLEIALPRDLAETQDAIKQAQESYQPKPYTGRVTLFRASKQPVGIYPNPTMGWGGLAVGELDIHEVPGYHAAIISEPRVQRTAEILRECLNRARTNKQLSEVLSYSAVCLDSLQKRSSEESKAPVQR